MSDKIVVTLQELLDIANQELARLPESTLGSSVSKVSKGVGTFCVEIAGETSMRQDSQKIAKFAQSLYDRYLLSY
jgi:hypothetical protein